MIPVMVVLLGSLWGTEPVTDVAVPPSANPVEQHAISVPVSPRIPSPQIASPPFANPAADLPSEEMSAP